MTALPDNSAAANRRAFLAGAFAARYGSNLWATFKAYADAG